MDPTSPASWAVAQDALRAEVGRVTALLRSLDRADAPAVGQWDVAEVAMHLSQAFVAVPGLAVGDLAETYSLLPGMASRESGSLLAHIVELAATTALAVCSDPERDPAVLADRIEQRAEAFLAGCGQQAAEVERPWLVEGVGVVLPTFTYHLLNETVVHGLDIARASGRRWSVDRRHAALVVDGFVMPVIAALGPAMVDQDAAAGARASFDIRVRGGNRHVMVFDDGDLRVEPPSSRRVDCHLSVDPVGFLLVVWNRRSQWEAIARGELLAWGRRPWLGLKLRGMVRSV